MILTNRSCIC